MTTPINIHPPIDIDRMLSEHEKSIVHTLRDCPRPPREFKPEAVERLVRFGLVETIDWPSPYTADKGGNCQHVRLTAKAEASDIRPRYTNFKDLNADLPDGWMVCEPYWPEVAKWRWGPEDVNVWVAMDDCFHVTDKVDPDIGTDAKIVAHRAVADMYEHLRNITIAMGYTPRDQGTDSGFVDPIRCPVPMPNGETVWFDFAASPNPIHHIQWTLRLP